MQRRIIDSKTYWDNRYKHGGTSGDGSYGRLADYKARIINDFLNEHSINTVIEFGCGDGNQLGLVNWPKYVGTDISPTAIEMCRSKFSSVENLSFEMLNDLNTEPVDLTISMDVIYHLIEDEIFISHMKQLFYYSNQFVIIYSSDFDERGAGHVRHRRFSDWIKANISNFDLMTTEENPFHISKKLEGGPQSSASIQIYKKIEKSVFTHA
jgi:SAM-dependent methyltransferase